MNLCLNHGINDISLLAFIPAPNLVSLTVNDFHKESDLICMQTHYPKLETFEISGVLQLDEIPIIISCLFGSGEELLKLKYFHFKVNLENDEYFYYKWRLTNFLKRYFTSVDVLHSYRWKKNQNNSSISVFLSSEDRVTWNSVRFGEDFATLELSHRAAMRRLQRKLSIGYLNMSFALQSKPKPRKAVLKHKANRLEELTSKNQDETQKTEILRDKNSILSLTEEELVPFETNLDISITKAQLSRMKKMKFDMTNKLENF